MGRHPWSSRVMVEQCRVIDIPFLYRHGYLDGFKDGGIVWRNSRGERTASIDVRSHTDMSGNVNSIELYYAIHWKDTGRKEKHDYLISLTHSECYPKGKRRWLTCPITKDGERCGRRVGSLYLPPDGSIFGCRQCYDLTYRTQKEHNKLLDGFLALLGHGGRPGRARRHRKLPTA